MKSTRGWKIWTFKRFAIASTLFVSLQKQFLLEMGTIATLTPKNFLYFQDGVGAYASSILVCTNLV